MVGAASPGLVSGPMSLFTNFTLANVIINWLMLSALYALVAIGFTLIFGVGGVLNLAHGANITVGAYAAYLVTLTGVGIWVGSVAAILVPAAFSLALYWGLIRPVEESPITVLILTLVTALIVEQIIIVTLGTRPKTVASLVAGQVTVANATIETNRIALFVLSWLLIAAVFLFIERTDVGRAIRAASQDERGAALVGINSDYVSSYTWALAGALGGIAGLFLASLRVATPFMGRAPLLLSFAIVVLGGLGSVKGSIVGAYVVGLLDILTISVIPQGTRLSGLAPLVLLVVVLMIKPQGLFGHELAEG